MKTRSILQGSLILTSIFFGIFFIAHSALAVGVVAEQSTVHGTSTIQDQNWYLIVNETTTTYPIDVSQINLWLYYTTSTTAVADIEVRVLDNCGDYRSDLPGIGAHISATSSGTLYNTDLVEANVLKYYQFRTNTTFTLPAGYCYVLDLSAQANVYIGGNKVNNTTGDFAGGDLGYILNQSAPPYQAGDLVKDAFYVVCDELCLYLDSDISPIVESTTNLNCANEVGGLFGVVSVKYVACVFLVPSLGLDFLNQSFTDFQSVFPFSPFFSVRNSLQSALEDASTSPQSVSLTYNIPDVGTTTLVFFSSSTLDNTLGFPLKNDLFNLLLTILAGVIIYAMFILIV